MERFIERLRAAYGTDTCHPSYISKWSPENPTAGQCAITALLVHEQYGYDIFEVQVGRSRHFFNRNNNGDVIDLTAEQFAGQTIQYETARRREPKDLYKSCASRLDILKSKLLEKENENECNSFAGA